MANTLQQCSSPLEDFIPDVSMESHQFGNDSPLLAVPTNADNDLDLSIRNSKAMQFKLNIEDEDSDMIDSDEDKDMVEESNDLRVSLQSPALSGITYESFRQVDYLWLFDPYINFKERPEFK